MTSVILGMGEVGQALKKVLGGVYTIYEKDIEEKEPPKDKVHVLHVCLNYISIGHVAWLRLVEEYSKLYKPEIVDVCSTVRPGTTAQLGPAACHSTTRGLHPHLAAGILAIPKHVGGGRAGELAAYYQKAKVRCVIHRNSDTTEVAHIAHLVDYGIQLISADMRQKLCRDNNVDFMEAIVKYTDTHNSGFKALGMPSKIRMNLTPPNGRIGGHCVRQAAQLALESGFSHPLVDLLAGYGK